MFAIIGTARQSRGDSNDDGRYSRRGGLAQQFPIHTAAKLSFFPCMPLAGGRLCDMRLKRRRRDFEARGCLIQTLQAKRLQPEASLLVGLWSLLVLSSCS